ncbi:GNAT family N-acetyltransferase [Streptomyces sp. NPDC045431]|uniref:GNAT family N-acetyltransferase n=1 Tax=Streptomyces sp. NPDC045431 TaxID=3155613 RepID=UPI0033C8759B
MPITIRKAVADDVPTMLAIMDSAVVWLNARGITAQWGTEPFSASPKLVEGFHRYVAECSPWIAEIDGVPAGTMTLAPVPGAHVPPAGEPEVFVRSLATEGRHHGRGVGSALLAHAVEETRRQGVSLLRVDCFAGGEGRLVRCYERNGFTPTETFAIDDWPGQVLARRV